MLYVRKRSAKCTYNTVSNALRRLKPGLFGEAKPYKKWFSSLIVKPEALELMYIGASPI